MEPLSTTALAGAAITGATLVARSEFGKILYEDLAQGAVREVGGALTDATKLARAYVSGYLQQVAAGRERIERRVAEVCQEIPAERLVEPQPHVVAPIFNGLGLREDADPLAEFFKRLLRTAFDCRTQATYHPAFAQRLHELLPDEAVVLFHSKRMGVFVIPGDGARMRPLFPLETLVDPEHFREYVEHLIQLGLLTICDAKKALDMRIAQGIEKASKNVFPMSGIVQTVMPGKAIELTSFGQRFADACVPDDLPRASTPQDNVESAINE